MSVIIDIVVMNIKNYFEVNPLIHNKKKKFISIMLCASLLTAVFSGGQFQASAAEETQLSSVPQQMVMPLNFRYDQSAGQAITQKKQAEQLAAEQAAQAAAAQAAAEQAAAEQAAKKAQEEAAKKQAQKKSSSSNSNQSKKSKKSYSSSGSIGQRVVSAAKSCIGIPYGSSYDGVTFDCSGLVCWAYSQVGISLPHSSSGQAQMLNNSGKGISKSELQPGDLIFWQYPWGSGFMNIGHVGIYAGNNQVIDASPNGVVQRSLYDQNKMVFFARPY